MTAKPHLAQKTALPALDAIVFSRLAYGPTPRDAAAFNALGATPETRLERWIDQQLNPAALDDADCDARLKKRDLYALDRTQAQLWDEFMANNKFEGDNEKEYALKYLPMEHVRTATVLRALYSKRQVLEVLTDFWHNHFNVYPHDQEEIYTIYPWYHTNVIRKHALGNFRQMLQGVASSGAMQFYLDNATNRDEGPNENFARELLELHTLGAESYLGVRDPDTVAKDSAGVAAGYVDNDVYEVARCFTGWTFDMNADWWKMTNTGAFVYKKDWHDRFNKIVLGKYIPADQADMKDGKDALDLLANHPGTARHIATKLCRRLISDTPPKRVIDEAARVFLQKSAAADQLKQVVRVIVMSPEFRGTFAEKIRRPFEVAMAMLRGFGADVQDPRDMLWHFDAMGAPLYGRRPPDGFPDTRAAWTHSVSMVFRWRFAIAMSENWLKEGDRAVKIDLLAQTPEDKRAPDVAVDFWLNKLLLRPVAPATRNALIDMLAQGDQDSPESYGAWLSRTVQTIVMSPDYQLR